MKILGSIRSKLLAISLACVVLPLAASTAANSLFFRTQYTRALEANALIVANTLRLQLERMLNLGIFLGELEGFDRQCREAVAAHEAIAYVWVGDQNGQVVFSSDSDSERAPYFVSRIAPASMLSVDSEYAGDSVDGDHLEVSVPLRDSAGEYVGRVGVGVPYQRIRGETRHLALVSMATALLFVSAALLWLGIMLRSAVTAPLERLLEAIKGIGAHPLDPSAKLGPLPADEIGVIGRAFDDMSAKLRETHAALQDDIARRKEAEERLAQVAHYDSLTGIPNRVFFVEFMERRLSDAQRHGKRVALLFIDLDRFKLVNDTLGHNSGDALLVEVAARLRKHLRVEDLVARLGGDEFVVVVEALPNTEIAGQIADKLLSEMEQSVELEGRHISVTLSIGVSVFPDDGADLTTLMKNADAAMYKAKEAGKNNYKFYDAQMDAESSRRLTLESDLRQALGTKQLELDYQPLVSARGGEVVGVEALLRWNHPTLGRLMPKDFLETAEESGLVASIGEWALHRACEDAVRMKMHATGEFTVGVNVSAVQLRHPSFASNVLKAIESSHLDPGTLVLELTEFALMHDISAAKSVLLKLREAGVTLAIDDFGTGYSSLSYLQHLPVECLKVDQSFIRSLGTDQDSRAISAAIIGLAHNLGLKVVAEGVETTDQLNWLREHRCDVLQGFLFSPPVSRERVEQSMPILDTSRFLARTLLKPV